MQQLATVTTNGSAVTYDNGAFAVGGESATIEKVMEYDKLGILTWANDETKSWAYQLASAGPASPQSAVVAHATGTSAKTKKPWYKKWWVWAIAVLFIGAAASGAGGGSKGTSSASKSSESATAAVAPAANTAAPKPATPPAEQAMKIGQPLKVGDLVFTVNDATSTKKLTSPLGNKDGNWVVVNVTVKNESKEAVLIDSSFFKLLAADGSAYETDSDSLMYVENSTNFFLAKINPNLAKQGQVLFAVPDGAQPGDFSLQVQTGAFGTEKGKISLTK